MKLHILLASGFLALAACGGAGDGGLGPGTPGDGDGGGGGDPVTPGGPDDTPIADSPDTCLSSAFTCRGDISAVSYDSGTNTLNITALPFDRAPLSAEYRDTLVNIGNFDVYSNTYGVPPDGFIDTYEAIFTTNGDISVGVVGVEGYQTFGYKGTFYSLNNAATLPGNSLVQYTGTYAGLMDFFGNGSLVRTSGSVRIDADFTDDVIRGVITNRNAINDADGTAALALTSFDGPVYTQALPDIILVNTALIDGTFDGRAVSYIDEDVYEEGSYIGLIAGTDGATIGGIVEVTSGDAFPDVTGYDPGSRDTGAFITTTRTVIGTDP